MASIATHDLVQNRMHEQHETIKEQNGLIGRQAKLINTLALMIENNGLGHLLDNKKAPRGGGSGGGGAPPSDKSPADKESEQEASYGPGSPPVKWIGDASDIIPITIAGKDYKGFIFDDEIVAYWNWLLNLRRKIPKYKKEYDEEFDLSKDTFEELQECQERRKAGDLSVDTFETMTEMRIANHAALARQELIYSKLS